MAQAWSKTFPLWIQLDPGPGFSPSLEPVHTSATPVSGGHSDGGTWIVGIHPPGILFQPIT